MFEHLRRAVRHLARLSHMKGVPDPSRQNVPAAYVHLGVALHNIMRIRASIHDSSLQHFPLAQMRMADTTEPLMLSQCVSRAFGASSQNISLTL